MTACRDWLATLWPGSFKGVSFYFEQDESKGGRGLVIHEFPNRDTPYVEDLGEDPRFYSGTAYVHGDDADSRANSLEDTLSSRGVGELTVPIRGPVAVQSHKWTRRHERDRMGYVAFEVEFVREGAATAVVSVGSLASQVYAAAGTAASAVTTTLGALADTTDRTEPVVTAAVDAARAALVAVDAVRTSEPVETTASADAARLIETTYDLAPALLDADGVETVTTDVIEQVMTVWVDRPIFRGGAGAVAASVVTATRAIADAMPADDAVRAMGGLADALLPVASVGRSETARVAAATADALMRAGRLAALIALTEATVRRTFRSRPEGVTARADLAARFEVELERADGAANAALFVAIQELRARVVEYLSRTIADLAPVVDVAAARAMPSLWWSWRLYASAERGREIVARNGVPHPSFIPPTFQALAR